MKVVLTRPKQIMDIGRPYTIRTENAELGIIEAGQEVEVEVPSDAAELFASVIWYTSNRIPLGNMENNARLEIKNSCAGWKLLIPVLPLYYMTKKGRYLSMIVK